MLAAGGEPDDAAPAPAAGQVPARELGDEQRRRHRVDGELTLEGLRADRAHRPAEPVGVGRLEGVLDPAAGVVDQDVDRAEVFLGEVEQPGRAGRVGEVGLDGVCAAAGALDGGHHVGGVAAAGLVVSLLLSGRVARPVVRREHRHPAPAELDSGGGPDSLVRSGDDGDVLLVALDHGFILAGAWASLPFTPGTWQV
nr:hypothetical protein [Jiangella gansuensis]